MCVCECVKGGCVFFLLRVGVHFSHMVNSCFTSADFAGIWKFNIRFVGHDSANVGTVLSRSTGQGLLVRVSSCVCVSVCLSVCLSVCVYVCTCVHVHVHVQLWLCFLLLVILSVCARVRCVCVLCVLSL